jgi:hypothetical protein
MDLQAIDPKRAALKMVVYKALSGFIMVAIYSVFEIATIYIYHWLAVPPQVQAMPT